MGILKPYKNPEASRKIVVLIKINQEKFYEFFLCFVFYLCRRSQTVAHRNRDITNYCF